MTTPEYVEKLEAQRYELVEALHIVTRFLNTPETQLTEPSRLVAKENLLRFCKLAIEKVEGSL